MLKTKEQLEKDLQLHNKKTQKHKKKENTMKLLTIAKQENSKQFRDSLLSDGSNATVEFYIS